jgi:UDP-glucose 4-epimerase
MGSAETERVLVTGASGQIGRAVSSLLRDAGRNALLVDVDPATVPGAIRCDLRAQAELSQLFRAHSIGAVIHLAGILPSAFQSDPLGGADVNLNASLGLMQRAAESSVKRFIFASSMSVY